MKSELQAAGLIILLFVVTFSLGVEFGGSGLSGASGGFGSSGPAVHKESLAPPPPTLIIRAVSVNSSDLYATANSQQNISSQYLAPLVGLKVTVVEESRASFSGFGRLPSITLTTNSSGLASVEVSPGIYRASVLNQFFPLDTTVTMSDNQTTTLSLSLLPAAQSVGVVKVVSPDTATGLESTSRVYAQVGPGSIPSPGFAQLVGFVIPQESNSTGIAVIQPVTGLVFYSGLVYYYVLNATVLGSYPGSSGSWVTLAPTGNYSAYPTQGVYLFQYKPTYMVNYTAG